MSITTDHLEIFRLLLALALLLVNIAVWGGVYLENDRFSETIKQFGWKLLVYALGLEVAFATLLVVVDTTINTRQRAEIVRLETELSPRTLKDRQTIIEKLKSFSGVPFDISIQPESETINLLEQITAVLKDAGWVWKDSAIPLGSLTFRAPGKPIMADIVMKGGVRIQISESHRSDWEKAALTLRDALIAADIPSVEKVFADVSDTAIHIQIGTK